MKELNSSNVSFIRKDRDLNWMWNWKMDLLRKLEPGRLHAFHVAKFLLVLVSYFFSSFTVWQAFNFFYTTTTLFT